MLRDVALDENCGHVGIETDSEQSCCQFESLRSDNSRSIRRGQSVKIDDSVESVVLRLSEDPLPQGSEIVAQMNLACGLDAGQDTGHSPRLPFGDLIPERSSRELHIRR